MKRVASVLAVAIVIAGIGSAPVFGRTSLGHSACALLGASRLSGLIGVPMTQPATSYGAEITAEVNIWGLNLPALWSSCNWTGVGRSFAVFEVAIVTFPSTAAATTFFQNAHHNFAGGVGPGGTPCVSVKGIGSVAWFCAGREVGGSQGRLYVLNGRSAFALNGWVSPRAPAKAAGPTTPWPTAENELAEAVLPQVPR